MSIEQGSSYAVIIELATALNRMRSLTDTESMWLEEAIRRQGRGSRRKTVPWSRHDDELVTMLAKGIRPAQIATRLKRTPRAIYRRMYKLGLSCNGSVVAVAAEG